MKIGAAFPSKFLRADDLGDNEVTVTIDKVEVESVGQGEDQDDKPVLYFKGKQKGLVLNKTNANTISAVLGSDDTDDWAGGAITLFATQTDFGGKTVDCIRVRNKKPKAAPTQAARVAKGKQVIADAEGDAAAAIPDDDDIPF